MASPLQVTEMTNCAISSSRNEVVNCLTTNIQLNLVKNKWLNSRNVYKNNVVSQIKSQWAGSSFNNKDLKEYISTSVFLHSKEGWDYLSCAYSAYLNGEYSKVIHFAYYAELRATMSILASDGIGVFDKKHLYIDSSGNVKKVLTKDLGTHEFAWFAMEKWIDENSKSILIFDTIKIQGYSINDWLNATSLLASPLSTSVVMQDWMKKWSIDLQQLRDDRTSRNESSYRSIDINGGRFQKYNIKTELNHIRNMWKLSEPSSSESFRLLDAVLLAQTIHVSYKSINTVAPSPAIINQILNQIESTLGISISDQLKHIIKNPNKASYSKILSKAKLPTKDLNDKFRVDSILSRAFLLLRMSSACSSHLIELASLNKSHLENWTNRIGIEQGLWDHPNNPLNFEDLWSDIDDSIIEIDDWSNSRTLPSKYDYFQNLKNNVSCITQCQRVHLWGLNI